MSDMLMGTVVDDRKEYQIVKDGRSGLCYCPDINANFDVYEQMSGYLDEGPECVVCARIVYDEPVIIWAGDDPICLDCAEREGSFIPA